MPYTHYISSIIGQLSKSKKKSFNIIEIGIGSGATLIPLLTSMSKLHLKFDVYGVDVLISDELRQTLEKIQLCEGQKLSLFCENSLTILPRLVEENKKFDVMLIDGDHNYYTVSQELSYIERLVNFDDDPIVVLDDYSTKWATRDLWYSSRPGYEKNEIASKVVSTEKHGVKIAIDEFVHSSKKWKRDTSNGEFVVLKAVK